MPGFNIQKQIDHWKNGSIDAMETAELLIDKGKILFGLFFCHLAIEKVLKAHFVRCTKTLAPKTHDLYFLISKIDFTLEDSGYQFLRVLMRYQLEGRYPENQPIVPSGEVIEKYFSSTKELFEWLIQKL